MRQCRTRPETPFHKGTHLRSRNTQAANRFGRSNSSPVPAVSAHWAPTMCLAMSKACSIRRWWSRALCIPRRAQPSARLSCGAGHEPGIQRPPIVASGQGGLWGVAKYGTATLQAPAVALTRCRPMAEPAPRTVSAGNSRWAVGWSCGSAP